MEHFLNRIRIIANAKGMSQAELARKTGYRPQEVERFWNNKRELHASHIRCFSKALNVHQGELLEAIYPPKIKEIADIISDFGPSQINQIADYIHFIKEKSGKPIKRYEQQSDNDYLMHKAQKTISDNLKKHNIIISREQEDNLVALVYQAFLRIQEKHDEPVSTKANKEIAKILDKIV